MGGSSVWGCSSKWLGCIETPNPPEERGMRRLRLQQDLLAWPSSRAASLRYSELQDQGEGRGWQKVHPSQPAAGASKEAMK